VILALEIIEKRTLAHVRSFRDVLDGDGRKATFRKQLQCAPKQPQTGFGGTTLAAANCGRKSLDTSSEGVEGTSGSPFSTFVHIRTLDIYDHWSLIVPDWAIVKSRLFGFGETFGYER
jgi:hypothetical protein